MGYRTVVILNNDLANEWQKDPLLGDKIAHDMNYVTYPVKDRTPALVGVGRVVECAHADQQTLMLLDSLDGMPVAYSHWQRGEQFDEIKVKMLRELANSLGYRIVRKPA